MSRDDWTSVHLRGRVGAGGLGGASPRTTRCSPSRVSTAISTGVGGRERGDAAVAPLGGDLVEEHAQVAGHLPDRVGGAGGLAQAHQRAVVELLADHQIQLRPIAEQRAHADPVRRVDLQLLVALRARGDDRVGLELLDRLEGGGRRAGIGDVADRRGDPACRRRRRRSVVCSPRAVTSSVSICRRGTARSRAGSRPALGAAPTPRRRRRRRRTRSRSRRGAVGVHRVASGPPGNRWRLRRAADRQRQRSRPARQITTGRPAMLPQRSSAARSPASPSMSSGRARSTWARSAVSASSSSDQLTAFRNSSAPPA